MPSITKHRKQQFCHRLLHETGAIIGFADVGSGGILKAPWNLLPLSHFRKFDFEPTAVKGQMLPLCVSNREGKAQFLVARDERASSFHRVVPEFAERFGMQSLYPVQAIDVNCTTLDCYFDGKLDAIDAIDVNVEGHDHQVLQGATQLLQTGGVKLLKVEFELASVWSGQSWFGDIDALLRSDGYVLAGIDIDFVRPVNVRHYFHRGEPVWGKALYVPGVPRWNTMLHRRLGEGYSVEHELTKAIVLYIAADILGHAFDVIDIGASSGGVGILDADRLKARIGFAYRWARLERGVREFLRLVSRAIGLSGVASEA